MSRPAAGAQRARVCLNMIVRNEAAIIERCLAAAAPAIDAWVICDTGSTDGTPDVIRSFLAARGIPGELHASEFGNFAQARNVALDHCRESRLDFDYLLLADADMELRVDDAGFRNGLGAPAYTLLQKNRLAYWNTRLVRRDAHARYVGATHEYLSLDVTTERLRGLWFVDHASGSNRGDKCERDIRLLEAALAGDPGDVRSMFYLAQTLLDAGRPAEARRWYERRIEAGGWDEEVWYARYSLARCDVAMDHHESAIAACLAAYNARPTRAEPLHLMSRALREHGENDAALLACDMAERIPFPEHDVLFVDDFVYRHGFAEERSIAGFYSKQDERVSAGRAACLALSTRRDAPPDTRAAARRNWIYYAQSAEELFGPHSRSELTPALPPPFRPFNPSVLLEDSGLRCLIRTADYSIEFADTGTRYVLADATGVVRTRNYLVTLDDAGGILDCDELTILGAMPPRHAPYIQGFEDCRLFRWRGSLWCVCTTMEFNADSRCEMALLELDDGHRIARAVRLRGYHDDLYQKNWVPAVVGDELLLLYGSDPFVMLRVDLASGTVTEHCVHAPPLALDHLRGGSQLVAFDGGWLHVPHEVAYLGERRCYMHRFVLLDSTFALARLSEPFYFTKRGIEFVAGLAWDAAQGELIVSFGVDDAQGYVVRLDAERVRATLAPPV